MGLTSPNGANKSVTLQDIADYCGVSRAVVSVALRGDRRHASVETIARIHEAAKILGYNPARYHAARRLVNMRDGKETLNYLVALYAPHDYHAATYTHMMVSGVVNEMADNEYGVLIVQERPVEPSRFLTSPRAMIQGEVDGLISLLGPEFQQQALPVLRAEPGFGDRSVVTLIHEGEGLSSVVADDLDGGYQAMKHLLELGHRHILSDERDYGPPHSLRVDGYRKALIEYGLDPDDGSVLSIPWYRSLQKITALDVVAELERHPEVTGFLAYNDVSVLEVVFALRQRGVRIPDDISVVGYDDTHSLPDQLGVNKLTTVRLPLLELGQAAAQLIIRLMRSTPRTEEHLVLPVELMVRGSTGPPRTR